VAEEEHSEHNALKQIQLSSWHRCAVHCCWSYLEEVVIITIWKEEIADVYYILVG